MLDRTTRSSRRGRPCDPRDGFTFAQRIPNLVDRIRSASIAFRDAHRTAREHWGNGEENSVLPRKVERVYRGRYDWKILKEDSSRRLLAERFKDDIDPSKPGSNQPRQTERVDLSLCFFLSPYGSRFPLFFPLPPLFTGTAEDQSISSRIRTNFSPGV